MHEQGSCISEMSGIFFQDQGIVREFCNVSEKNKTSQNCQGILHFSCIKLGIWSKCIFLATSIKFQAPMLSGIF